MVLFLEKRIPSERASQEEQNGTNFSSIAPSSKGVQAFLIHSVDDLYQACTFEVSVPITPHWKVL